MVSLTVVEETSLAQICNDLQTVLDKDKVTVLQRQRLVEAKANITVTTRKQAGSRYYHYYM